MDVIGAQSVDGDEKNVAWRGGNGRGRPATLRGR
jgi:hypothetical protein